MKSSNSFHEDSTHEYLMNKRIKKIETQCNQVENRLNNVELINDNLKTQNKLLESINEMLNNTVDEQNTEDLTTKKKKNRLSDLLVNFVNYDLVQAIGKVIAWLVMLYVTVSLGNTANQIANLQATATIEETKTSYHVEEIKRDSYTINFKWDPKYSFGKVRASYVVQSKGKKVTFNEIGKEGVSVTWEHVGNEAFIPIEYYIVHIDSTKQIHISKHIFVPIATKTQEVYTSFETKDKNGSVIDSGTTEHFPLKKIDDNINLELTEYDLLSSSVYESKIEELKKQFHEKTGKSAEEYLSSFDCTHLEIENIVSLIKERLFHEYK